MVYTQLPSFTKEIDDCENIFERIIYVLKHMEILQRMPFLAQDAVFKRLSEIAEVASLSKEERRQYDESLKHYRDTIAVMHGQYLEGMEKGIEKGEAIGMEKGEALGIEKERVKNARKMKDKGIAPADIAEITGLSVDVINSLMEKRKQVECNSYS